MDHCKARRQTTSCHTSDALSVERDVSSMLSGLERYVRDEEMSGTKGRDAVRDVLTRRSRDADLERPFASVTHVDCNRKHVTALSLRRKY